MRKNTTDNRSLLAQFTTISISVSDDIIRLTMCIHTKDKYYYCYEYYLVDQLTAVVVMEFTVARVISISIVRMLAGFGTGSRTVLHQ